MRAWGTSQNLSALGSGASFHPTETCAIGAPGDERQPVTVRRKETRESAE